MKGACGRRAHLRQVPAADRVAHHVREREVPQAAVRQAVAAQPRDARRHRQAAEQPQLRPGLHELVDRDDQVLQVPPPADEQDRLGLGVAHRERRARRLRLGGGGAVGCGGGGGAQPGRVAVVVLAAPRDGEKE